MAGDWIPHCKSLSRKPEVLAVARATGKSRREVHSLLLDLWCWADEETEDGFLPHLDLEQLAEVLGEPVAFWRAVVAVGWLAVRPDGLSIPNFDRWMGQSAKRRLNKNRRQARWRSGGGDATADAPVDPAASTGAPTTEEKRTEEDRTEEGSSLFAEAAGPDAPTAPEFMAAWNEAAARCGWSKCERLGPDRLKHFRARGLEAYWAQSWRFALHRAEGSQWLRGGNDRGWRANVDWFLRPGTITRILEGAFDDRNQGGGNRAGGDVGLHSRVRAQPGKYDGIGVRVGDPAAPPPGAPAGVPDATAADGRGG